MPDQLKNKDNEEEKPNKLEGEKIPGEAVVGCTCGQSRLFPEVEDIRDDAALVKLFKCTKKDNKGNPCPGIVEVRARVRARGL